MRVRRTAVRLAIAGAGVVALLGLTVALVQRHWCGDEVPGPVSELLRVAESSDRLVDRAAAIHQLAEILGPNDGQMGEYTRLVNDVAREIASSTKHDVEERAAHAITVLDAIGMSCDARLLSAVMHLVRSPEANVRIEAIPGLGWFRPGPEQKCTIQHALVEGSPGERIAATVAVIVLARDFQVEFPEAWVAVRAALEDRAMPGAVRAASLSALWQQGAITEDELRAYVHDPQEKVAKMATQWNSRNSRDTGRNKAEADAGD